MRIFVFGSNLAGRHGLGDALTARQKHGAIYGKGEGLQGHSYGIPTKDEYTRTLPLVRIRPAVERFLVFAAVHPEMEFDIQKVGCRNAGYAPVDIAPFFAGAPQNCFLPAEFRAVLREAGLPFNDADLPAAQGDSSQGSLFD